MVAPAIVAAVVNDQGLPRLRTSRVRGLFAPSALFRFLTAHSLTAVKTATLRIRATQITFAKLPA